MGLKVTSFSSKGRVTRISSNKCIDKVVHLQSDNQLRVFLIFEWCNKVKHIAVSKELEDLEVVINDIGNLRLDKFRDKETGKLYKLYTNFIVTLNDEKIIAVAVKSSGDLEKRITIEKLEIERRYWEAKGIVFRIITEKEINKVLVNNISWVRETVVDRSIKNKEDLAEKLYYFIQENKKESVNNLLNIFDIKESLREGTALFMFRYLIADKQVDIDMYKPVNLNEIVENILHF